jgi:hypothetical protein
VLSAAASLVPAHISSASEIPTELFNRFVDELKTDHETLRALCLTSHMFRTIALSHLFSRLVIEENLSRWVELSEGFFDHSIPDCVHEVRLKGHHMLYGDTDSQSIITLPLLSNASAFVWSGEGYTTADECLSLFLVQFLLSMPNVHTVVLGAKFTDPIVLAHFLSLFQHLETLFLNSRRSRDNLPLAITKECHTLAKAMSTLHRLQIPSYLATHQWFLQALQKLGDAKPLHLRTLSIQKPKLQEDTEYSVDLTETTNIVALLRKFSPVLKVIMCCAAHNETGEQHTL